MVFIKKKDYFENNNTNDNNLNFEITKKLNLENKKMTLLQNHKIILEIFDNLNSVLNNEFDCYYTGGLMLFISENENLIRYHNDIDLFVNEEQLFDLKNRINDSKDFQFVSNMNKKGVNGHEYKITYRKIPISVGLFLFERKNDGGIITKKYYYEDLPNMKNLYVDERHFNFNYSKLFFNNHTLLHNKLPYKMVSLEYIFYSKKYLKPVRPKDEFDITYIEDKIDVELVEAINKEKQKKVDIVHKKINNSVIKDIEKSMKCNTKKRFIKINS